MRELTFCYYHIIVGFKLRSRHKSLRVAHYFIDPNRVSCFAIGRTTDFNDQSLDLCFWLAFKIYDLGQAIGAQRVRVEQVAGAEGSVEA